MSGLRASLPVRAFSMVLRNPPIGTLGWCISIFRWNAPHPVAIGALFGNFSQEVLGWEVQIRVRGRLFGFKADAHAWVADTESEIARGVYRERGQDTD